MQNTHLTSKSILEKCDKEKLHLIGSVKLLKEYSYNGQKKSMEVIKGSYKSGKAITFDKNGNKTEEIWYDSKQIIIKKHIFCYDSQGDMVEEIHYNSDATISLKIKYVYSKQRKKIEQIIYNSDGSLKEKELYRYNSQGDEIEVITFNPDGTIKRKITYDYKYDESGYKIEILSYNTEVKIAFNGIYTYDENGNKIKEILSNNGIVYQQSIYKHFENYIEVHDTSYDEDGQLECIQNSISDKNGNYIGEANDNIIKFDENGNLVTFNFIDDVGENELYFEYEYDAIGNWIKRIDHSSIAYDNVYEKEWHTNKYVLIIEREIEYYGNNKNNWWNIFRIN